MKPVTPGERLRSARSSKGLSQQHVAQLIGTSQGMYSHWERERRPVPPEFIPPLCEVLGLDPAALVALSRKDGERAEGTDLGLPGYRNPFLPAYPVQGTVEEMLHLGCCAIDVRDVVRQKLTGPQLGRLDSTFPRDTPTELLCAYHVINHGFRPARSTLQRLHCPVLVVEGNWSASTAAHYVRDMLVLQKEDVTIAMTPQVWVPSIIQSEWYRLDFLTMIRGKDGQVRWADVEIDGPGHEYHREGDRRRSRGIPVPRLGYWNRLVESYDFGERLLRDLRHLLQKPPPSFVTRR